MKNQGRQDIKDRWQEIENHWIDVIRKQTGEETIQWVNPNEHLSYQTPEKPFEIFEEDFAKTMMDYLMFKEGIDAKEFGDKLLKKILYSSEVKEENKEITIFLEKEVAKDE